MARPRGIVLLLAVCVGMLLSALGNVWGKSGMPTPPPTPTPDTRVRVAVVIGSARVRSNSAGVGAWAAERVRSAAAKPYEASDAAADVVVEVVDLARENLGATFEHVPSRGPANYDTVTRAWSARVSAWDGALVVVPEYNGAMSGVLKTALDRLKREWAGLPLLVISVGGRGGARALAASRPIWSALAFDLVGELSVPLRNRVSVETRVRGDESWFEDHGDEIDRGIAALLPRAAARRDRRLQAEGDEGQGGDGQVKSA